MLWVFTTFSNLKLYELAQNTAPILFHGGEVMLIKDEIEIKCVNSNKKYVMSRGYEWKLNEIINFKISDLARSSNKYVEVKCDYCGDEMKKQYYAFMNSRKDIDKDSCKKCNGKKQKEVNMLLYGTEMSPKKIDAISNLRHDFEYVKQTFEDRGYILLEKQYVNTEYKMRFSCLLHPEIEQSTPFKSLISGHGCKGCASEKMIKYGAESHLWKGGITPLSHHMREIIVDWKKKSLESTGYKCFVTNKKENLHVHHLINFNSILKETLNELQFPTYENISNYTDSELSILTNTFIDKHNSYGLGIPLTEKVHREYHKNFGLEDGNPQLFVDFCNQHYNMNISIDDLYETEKLAV